MATQTWIRSENFIDKSTEDNCLLARDIFNEITVSLLAGIADADILEYYEFFLPYNTDYRSSFLKWSVLISGSPGNTLGVKQLVEQLRGTEIQKWDVAVQHFYSRDTSTYLKLFPKFRKPYQNGAVEIRKKTVETLISAIGDDANLVSLKSDVQTFFDLLTAAIDKQEGQFKAIVTATTELEEARFAAAEASMYVYGKLVSKYYKTLKVIENYFPVDMLQRIMQELFVATLKNNKARFMFKRKMNIEIDTIQVKTVGKNSVIGFFNNGLTSVLGPDDWFVSFPPNSLANYNPADMGYTDEKRYFHIAKKGVGTQVVSLKLNIAA